MKKTIVTLFLFLFVSIPLFSQDIASVKVEDQITLASQKLILNGAGVRSKFIFDIYVGSLYLKTKDKDADKIISSKEPMDIRMQIISSLVTSNKMKEGMKEAFEKAKKAGYDCKKQDIDKFLQSFNEEINKKDIFDFLYTPNSGINIYKNGKYLFGIDDFDFKKALFAIWLSKDPAQESLKIKMLGG